MIQGTILFEVVNTERIWVRVPVYVGQWREVDTSKEAVVKEFGDPPQSTGLAARPVVAPPSANPDAATVDLFYELSNPEGRLRPGHKVEVTVLLKATGKAGQEVKVIPLSLVAAAVVLRFVGVTMNTMVLAGLVIGFGGSRRRRDHRR